MARSLSMTCSLSMCTLARSRSPSLDEHSRYVVLSFLVGVASVYTSCPEATRHKAAIRGDYKICTSDTDRRQPTLPCPTAPSQNHVKPYFRVGNRLFLEYGRPHPTAKHNGNARGGGGEPSPTCPNRFCWRRRPFVFSKYTISGPDALLHNLRQTLALPSG